jgi:hypothetical protein
LRKKAPAKKATAKSPQQKSSCQKEIIHQKTSLLLNSVKGVKNIMEFDFLSLRTIY